MHFSQLYWNKSTNIRVDLLTSRIPDSTNTRLVNTVHKDCSLKVSWAFMRRSTNADWSHHVEYAIFLHDEVIAKYKIYLKQFVQTPNGCNTSTMQSEDKERLRLLRNCWRVFPVTKENVILEHLLWFRKNVMLSDHLARSTSDIWITQSGKERRQIQICNFTIYKT